MKPQKQNQTNEDMGKAIDRYNGAMPVNKRLKLIQIDNKINVRG